MFSVKTLEIPFTASEIAGRVECHTVFHATCSQHGTLRTASGYKIARTFRFVVETADLTLSSRHGFVEHTTQSSVCFDGWFQKYNMQRTRAGFETALSRSQ
jgi:hypothetical protein